jgi:hypothetical protein
MPFGICFFMLASERIELREARAVKQKGPGDLFVSEMRERVLFAWRALQQANGLERTATRSLNSPRLHLSVTRHVLYNRKHRFGQDLLARRCLSLLWVGYNTTNAPLFVRQIYKSVIFEK